MMDLGKLIKDAEAMKHFGNTMVLWNLKSMQPEKIFSVPGAPLEIRWSLKEGDDWAITASALTSKLWLINHDANDEWQAKEVGTIGDPAKIPLPVDISISADAKTLWVNTFMDGTTHLFDISDPTKPVQIYEKVTGKQVNMISQSWDGKRVYITSSLLANWDKKGADNEQVLRAYDWDGKDLTLKFEVDFFGQKLGRPHHMKFSGPLEKASLDMPSARHRGDDARDGSVFVQAVLQEFDRGGGDFRGRPAAPRGKVRGPAAAAWKLHARSYSARARGNRARRHAVSPRALPLHDGGDHASCVFLFLLRRSKRLSACLGRVRESARRHHRARRTARTRPACLHEPRPGA